ncbi:hypothetical protein JD969_04320 [Planctomycetota bacterium]|nr:hypothetical protein JD969_04320 [Planctomycetota bacterium]
MDRPRYELATVFIGDLGMIGCRFSMYGYRVGVMLRRDMYTHNRKRTGEALKLRLHGL